ncbi:TPA: excisionase [Staphylococcus aureus]|nr:excisionase [Staphylococcus aureus]
MCAKFTDAEIAYIKESVENYSSEFDIYDDEQELKLKIYEQIMLKIKSEYKDTYLFRLIN